MIRPLFFIRRVSLLILLLTSRSCGSRYSNVTDGNSISSRQREAHGAARRPVMFTFFERLSADQKFSSVQDEEDDALLEFWKRQWHAAGWEPRVLTLLDAEQHPEYTALKAKLDDIRMDRMSEIYILRWIAMAQQGGGFWCDYDVFPLRDFREEAHPLPNRGEMTVFGIGGAPTLASGAASAWLSTAKFLVEDAVRHRNPNHDKLTYWTDTLGMYNAVRTPEQTVHVQKSVLGINKAMSEKPLTAQRCNEKPYRGQRVVHVDYTGLLTAAIRPELRLPKHRLTVANEWLPLWKENCYLKNAQE